MLLFHVDSIAYSRYATVIESGRFSNFASVGSRWTLWRISMEAALAHPLLGIGPMHFAYVDNGEGAHPHNFWLQLAAEWGHSGNCSDWRSVTVAFFVRLWPSRSASQTDA
jgi:O-antigen ligase